MGRPTELTPEKQETLTKALRLLPIKTACDIAGISRETYRQWCKRGEAGEEPYAGFLALARASRGQFVANQLESVITHGERDWKATAWYLERVHPREFQPRSKTESKVTAKVEAAQSVAPSTLAGGAELLKSLGLAAPIHADPVHPTPADEASGGGTAV